MPDAVTKPDMMPPPPGDPYPTGPQAVGRWFNKLTEEDAAAAATRPDVMAASIEHILNKNEETQIRLREELTDTQWGFKLEAEAAKIAFPNLPLSEAIDRINTEEWLTQNNGEQLANRAASKLRKQFYKQGSLPSREERESRNKMRAATYAEGLVSGLSMDEILKRDTVSRRQ